MSVAPDVVVIPGDAASSCVPATVARLIATSAEASFAVMHVRLHTLYGVAASLSRLKSCRIVLADLDVDALDFADTVADSQLRGLAQLLGFARSGRLEVRSSGAVRWNPDLSVFQLARQRPGAICVVGAHYLMPPHRDFERPLTFVIRQHTAVATVQQHFETIWRAAHDALPAYIDTLERMISV